MRIIDICEVTKPIASPIRNAYIDFSKMTASVVAVVTDVKRGDLPALANAYARLIVAAGGGTLGLFTAIGRLRATYQRIAPALEEAGFPLYDERDEDGHVSWRLDGQVLKGLETGFTLAELCAMYLSRNLLEAVAGSPFQRDLALAFARIEKMLSPRMRQFLDRLPGVLVAKSGPQARFPLGWCVVTDSPSWRNSEL